MTLFIRLAPAVLKNRSRKKRDSSQFREQLSNLQIVSVIFSLTSFYIKLFSLQVPSIETRLRDHKWLGLSTHSLLKLEREGAPVIAKRYPFLLPFDVMLKKLHSLPLFPLPSCLLFVSIHISFQASDPLSLFLFIRHDRPLFFLSFDICVCFINL